MLARAHWLGTPKPKRCVGVQLRSRQIMAKLTVCSPGYTPFGMLCQHNLKAVLGEAAEEVRKALRLDEQDAWAHMSHRMVLFRMRRPAEAERAYRRALELNPSFALAHATLGWLLAVRGANEEAIKSAERALRLSPSDPRVGATVSHVITFARFSAQQYSDCVASARELIERHPQYHPARYVLISAAAMNGDIDMASDALAGLLRLQPDFSLT